MHQESLTLAICLFIIANVLTTLNDYRKNRTLSKQPFSWLTDNLCHGLIYISLVLSICSCYNNQTGYISTALIVTRGSLLIAILLITRATTKVGLLCREMYVRWHIFGNR